MNYYDAFRTITQEEKDAGIEIRWAGHYECGPTYGFERILQRYMLIYIINGHALYKNENNEIISLGSGNIVFYRPYEPQYFKADPTDPMTYLGVTFNGSLIDKIMKESSIFCVRQQKISVNHQLVMQFDQMINEILLKRNNISLLGHILQIVGRLENLLIESSEAAKNSDPVQKIIAKSASYMMINYHKKLTISEIASVSGYSVSRFQYLFNKFYGISATDFLINERINKAKDLLRTSMLNITEICRSVGFTDQYYFSKMFKQKTGYSPRAFRKGADQG